ncbi:hypothetical protein AB0H20_19380 [Nocardia fluminea]|uniref:hypothetical protein n=1 Tax=Nocardia fluminea TaxID=134984 RepID=UPI0033C625D6
MRVGAGRGVADCGAASLMVGERQRSDDGEYRRAALYVVGVVGVAALVFAAVNGWAASRGACAAAQTHLCDTPSEAAIVIGPSAILLLGGIGAFVRTYQRWRAAGSWRTWQGAGWFLFILMTAYLALGAGTIAA